MKTLLVGLMLLTGCAAQDGAGGTPGPAGPAGPAGAPGPGATGRLVWKDASGAVVALDINVYQDAHGWIWYMDPETARPTDAIARVSTVYYAGAGCSGQAYVSAFGGVGAPFRLPGESAYRVRAPNQLSAQVAILSQNPGTSCAALSATLRVIPVPALPAVAIQEPSWPFVPPLHVEREP